MSTPQSGNIGLKANHGFGSLQRNEDTVSEYMKKDGMENNYEADVFRSNKSVFYKNDSSGTNSTSSKNTSKNNTFVKQPSTSASSASIFGANNKTSNKGGSKIAGGMGTASSNYKPQNFDVELSQNITRSFTGTMMNVPGQGWMNNGAYNGVPTQELTSQTMQYIQQSITDAQKPYAKSYVTQQDSSAQTQDTSETDDTTSTDETSSDTDTDSTSQTQSEDLAEMKSSMMAELKAYILELFQSLLAELSGEST